MNINNRIKKLEREANAKYKKYHTITIEIAEWYDCGNTCAACIEASNLPVKEFIDGELVINVGGKD